MMMYAVLSNTNHLKYPGTIPAEFGIPFPHTESMRNPYH